MTAKTQPTADAIATADEVRRLTAAEQRALPGMVGKIAPAMVARYGHYTYTDAATGRKVCIVAR